MKTLKILSVKIDNLAKTDLMAKIKLYLADAAYHQIATVNPEFLVEARFNDSFLSLLDRLDLRLADGVGLKWAGWLRGVNINRLTGADLVVELLDWSQSQCLTVGIINRRDGLSSADDIAMTLSLRWPTLRYQIVDVAKGDWSPDLSALKAVSCQLVFCTLGAPFQDQLIYKNLPSLGVSLGIGVGGSFDYLTGRVKRAPAVLRLIGLEWLWRLIQSPLSRGRRIWNAVVLFPFYLILDDYLHPFFYRPNVVAFIYQADEVLIVNSAKEQRDFWKLPQGGVDAWESSRAAVIREMTEELSLEHYTIKDIYRDLYKYDWPPGYSIRGFKGQCQSLCLIEYHGDQGAIKLDWENRAYRWVKIDKLLDSVNPVLRPAYQIFLDKYHQSLI